MNQLASYAAAPVAGLDCPLPQCRVNTSVNGAALQSGCVMQERRGRTECGTVVMRMGTPVWETDTDSVHSSVMY